MTGVGVGVVYCVVKDLNESYISGSPITVPFLTWAGAGAGALWSICSVLLMYWPFNIYASHQLRSDCRWWWCIKPFNGLQSVHLPVKCSLVVMLSACAKTSLLTDVLSVLIATDIGVSVCLYAPNISKTTGTGTCPNFNQFSVSLTHGCSSDSAVHYFWFCR